MRCPRCQQFNLENVRFCTRCGQELPYFNRYEAPPPQSPQQNNQQSRPNKQQQQQHQQQYRDKLEEKRQQNNKQQGKQQNSNQQNIKAQWKKQQPANQQQSQQTTQKRRRGTLEQLDMQAAQQAGVLQEPVIEIPVEEGFQAPRTVQAWKELVEAALTYEFVSEEELIGRKRLIRISYPRGDARQQLATLYRAWQELREKNWQTIIIEGVSFKGETSPQFTNGQLTVNLGVRLGSEMITRYILETDNGLSGSSLRVVLTEPGA